MGCRSFKQHFSFTYEHLWSIVLQTFVILALIAESSKLPNSGVHHRQQNANGSSISSHSSSSSSASSSSSSAADQRIVRYYSLYGRCAESHVRMTSTRVQCSALDTNDLYTLFRAVSDSSDSRLRLQGVNSRTFLCFSRVGKLTVKHTWNSRSCLLQEHLSVDKDYVEFQSVHNATWFVGFNARGRRLVGDQWTTRPKLRKCFQFTKRLFRYHMPDESRKNARRQRRARPPHHLRHHHYHHHHYHHHRSTTKTLVRNRT